MAFAFWNQFLDVCDAIEDQAFHLHISHNDFKGTDIPSDFDLPKVLFSVTFYCILLNLGCSRKSAMKHGAGF
jgi:hypothetical protein